MSITVPALKNVSFKAPYAGTTFQLLVKQILGRDGYLSGGAISDNGTLITIQPFAIVQRGIVAESTAAGTTLPVPTGPEPWYLLAALADDDPDSGILLTVTTDLLSAINGTVLGFKVNGVWQNPHPIDVRAAAERAAAELGVERGFVPRVVLDSGVVDEFVVGAGSVVDPDGIRRGVPLVTDESNEIARFSPLPAHPQRDRIDHFALRQREPFSAEIAHLQGGSLGLESGASATVSKAVTQRIAYHAKRGGLVAQQWYAWGDSTDLQIQGGPAGQAFAEDTLLTGSGTISWVWLPGQRASDSAVLVLFVDGTSLRLASFHPTTGAQIDAPVTIDTQANAISHVRAVLDAAEKLHVVFEHDEGATQQIYYARVQVASGSFGVADVTPRIARGSASARNDTWPSVAVDRKGSVHVVYASGTGSDEFGFFVHVVLDQGGLPVSETSFNGTAGCGLQEDPTDDLGFVEEVYSDFRRARVVVTPHDEVYAVMLASPVGDLPNHLMLYSPGLRSRLGFDIVNICTPLTGDGLGCDVMVHDAGDLRVVGLSNVGGSATHIRVIGIDTVFAPAGTIGDSQLLDAVLETGLAGTPSAQTNDLLVARGPDGDFAYSFALGSASWKKFPSFSTGALGATRATPHPKDVYLSGYRAPSNASGDLPIGDGRFGLFHAPPKRLLHPFLVGDRGGRYNGYDGLHEAVRVAARDGGTVEIRPGYYNFETGPLATIRLHSHVSLRGDGKVLLENCTIQVAASASFDIDSFAGNVLQSADRIPGLLEGDVLMLTGAGGTGLHRVRRVLPPDGATLTRVLLDNSSSSDDPPGGTTFQIFPVGVTIENLTLRAAIIDLANAYAPTVRGISVVGTRTTGQVIKVVDCQVALVDNVEALGLDTLGADAATALVLLDGGADSVVRNVRMRDGDGKIVFIANDCQRPHLIDVAGDRSDPTKKAFTINTGRTTPVFMTGCDGRSDDLDQAVIEPVAPVLRVSPDGGALTFEDDNTRAAAGIGDDRIKLTSLTAQQFNGSVVDVVTGAVNQRVRTAGDTMTGGLLPNADMAISLGSLADRWNAFLGFVDMGNDDEDADLALPNYAGHLIPVVPGGRNLGNDTNPWFVHAQNLRVHGVVDRDLNFGTDLHVNLEGTGEIRHGNRTVMIPMNSFEPVRNDGTAGGWTQGSRLLFGSTTGNLHWTCTLLNAHLITQLNVVEGDRIRHVEMTVRSTSGGSTITIGLLSCNEQGVIAGVHCLSPSIGTGNLTASSGSFEELFINAFDVGTDLEVLATRSYFLFIKASPAGDDSVTDHMFTQAWMIIDHPVP